MKEKPPVAKPTGVNFPKPPSPFPTQSPHKPQPAQPMTTKPAGKGKNQAAKTDAGGGVTPMRYHSTSGTQKSQHPFKSQPRTIRHLSN